MKLCKYVQVVHARAVTGEKCLLTLRRRLKRWHEMALSGSYTRRSRFVLEVRGKMTDTGTLQHEIIHPSRTKLRDVISVRRTANFDSSSCAAGWCKTLHLPAWLRHIKSFTSCTHVCGEFAVGVNACSHCLCYAIIYLFVDNMDFNIFVVWVPLKCELTRKFENACLKPG